MSSIALEQETIDLYQVGGNAIVQHFGLSRTTKDFDVLQYEQNRLYTEAEREFGKTSSYAKQNNFYLEPVPSALPAVPEGLRQRCTLVPGPWKHLKLWQPEIHDLIVTKLKRFSTQDRSDIRFLCDRFPIQPQLLRERVDSAFAWYYKDDEYQRGTREHLQIVIEYLEGQRNSL